jgi:hypothetical protein
MTKHFSVMSWGCEATCFMARRLSDEKLFDMTPETNKRSWSRTSEYTGDHRGFTGYMIVVNAELQIATGMPFGFQDLPDYLWRDAYDDQVEPYDAVQTFLEEEGIDTDDMETAE